jgi:diamine N-acetyltransferase
MDWVNEPDVTRNFAELRETITRDQELAFIERMTASKNDFLYAITDLDGHYIGNAGLHKIYWPALNARLGLVIGSESAKGLGQQALRLLCAVAFTEHNLHKVWLIHFDTNERMAHIVKKHGFSYEGTLREEYFTTKYHDMVRHSLLASEFEILAPSWSLPDQRR